MKVRCSRFFTKWKGSSDSGQALIWILLLIVLSTLAISAICRIALWRLDASIALMNQRKLIENWEIERVSLIKSAYPTSSFKSINIGSNQLATPVIPKAFASQDSLRIPVFKMGENNNPLFNWQAFLKKNPGGCLKLQDADCKELVLQEGSSLFFGNLDVDNLALPNGISIIVATGNISIHSLQLDPGANVEIFSGFDLVIDEVVGHASTLFLKSAHGRIKLINSSVIDCLVSPQVRIASKFPIQLKNKVIDTLGCPSVGLSPFWQNLRFLGDLSQKSLK